MAAGPTLAIIGRPNVGKSTLFNRLAGKRLALVHDRPGVTRDFRTAPARLGRLDFTIIDTPGLEEDRSDSLEAGMRRQAERALAQADLALFMIDARAGITPLDEHFAAWLRRSGRPVIVVANKVESRAGEPGVLEAHGLGLGDPVACSAEHGIGLGDLEDAVLAALQAAGIGLEAANAAEQEEPFADIELEEGTEEAGETGPPRLIRLAVVGRPNVGKSTLINALLGEERLLTGPTPGVTRDAIPIDWEWEGQPIRLVDTAGLRRKARVEDVLEKMSGGETMRAVRLAQVVVLVLDGEAILDRQDLTIAAHVVEEGRALVIAVNKWDAVPDRQAALQRLNDRLQTSLTQIRNVPTVTISALEGRNLGKLLDTVLATYRRWDTRVGTGPLNRWLGAALDAHAPPMVGGRRLKIRYMTQVKARPPSFALWCNRPEMMPAAYKRYLINGLREAFDLEGVPIRLLFRKGENPYT